MRIQDNGIGIRPEMLPLLFDMFQQADRVPGHVSEGLGIGLSLVRTLVEMHGGTVAATSGARNKAANSLFASPLCSNNHLVVLRRPQAWGRTDAGSNSHSRDPGAAAKVGARATITWTILLVATNQKLKRGHQPEA